MEFSELMEIVNAHEQCASELYDPSEDSELRGKAKTTESITVLLLSRNSRYRSLLCECLSRSTPKIHLVHSVDLAAARKQLCKRAIDLILLDTELDASAAYSEYTSELRIASTDNHLPVIVLVSSHEQQKIVEAYQCGVTDHLRKEDLQPGIVQWAIFAAIEKARVSRSSERALAQAVRTSRRLDWKLSQLRAFQKTHQLSSKMLLQTAQQTLHSVSGRAELGSANQNTSEILKLKQCLRKVNRLNEDIDSYQELLNGDLELIKTAENIDHIAIRCIQSFQDLAETDSVNVIYECAASDTTLLCDSLRMEQLITCMLHNSQANLSVGGSIYLGISTERKGETICITFKEIGADLLKKQFFNLSQDECGMVSVGQEVGEIERYNFGLLLCRSIITSHGGEIEIGNDGTEGREVSVRLPAQQIAKEA